MNLGEAIRDIRKQKGLKQKDLATAVGITHTYLSSVENGKNEPGKGLLTRISQALEVDEILLKFMAFDSSDVPESKRASFAVLEPTLKSLIKDIFL